MRTRRPATIEDLRVAVECLPRTTRIAMLEGLRSNDIIVGAYSSGGGICPMLAAHRAGGRTNLISFAKAWDRFALGGGRTTRPRPATSRELRVLITHLEASLLDEDLPRTELAAAIASHEQLVARREPEGRSETDSSRPSEPERDRPRPGDPDRSRELGSRPGWAWTRLVRSYNEYERALEWLEGEGSVIGERQGDALRAREYEPA
jgi:hypothetical protein